MKHMLSYWYHYAIMFEALFILTALDTGTRAGRFLLQEMAGRIKPHPGGRMSATKMVLAGLVFTSFWSYLVFTGEISTIWPIFGMSNQLLAATALTLGTVIILKTGKSLYALITAVPGLLMFGITLWAGTLNVTTNYLPHKNYVLTILSLVLMALAVFILVAAVRKGMVMIRAQTGQPADGQDSRFAGGNM
jgi:carbon starvation protein